MERDGRPRRTQEDSAATGGHEVRPGPGVDTLGATVAGATEAGGQDGAFRRKLAPRWSSRNRNRIRQRGTWLVHQPHGPEYFYTELI